MLHYGYEDLGASSLSTFGTIRYLHSHTKELAGSLPVLSPVYPHSLMAFVDGARSLLGRYSALFRADAALCPPLIISGQSTALEPLCLWRPTVCRQSTDRGILPAKPADTVT